MLSYTYGFQDRHIRPLCQFSIKSVQKPKNARTFLWYSKTNFCRDQSSIFRAVFFENFLHSDFSFWYVKMEGGGFEPPNPKERIYSPPYLATLLTFRSHGVWQEHALSDLA